MNDEHSNAQAITAAQFAAIRKAAAAARPEPVIFETDPPGDAPTTIWQEGHILVTGDVDESSHPALRSLAAAPARNADGTKQLLRTDRIKLLTLNNKDARTTRQIVEELNGQEHLRGKVSLNNLMYVTDGQGANLCPGDEPTPVRPFPETIPYPPPAPGNAGQDVRVLVIDTGLSAGWDDNHPWLRDPGQPVSEVDGDDELDTFGPDGRITQHAGHGTFIAGLIRCVAPRASVFVSGTMRWAGAMHEHEVARVILDALDSDPPPHIISLSAGCMIPTEPGTGFVGPTTMLDVMARMRQDDCRTLLVAAAGNDGKGPDSEQPNLFFPAAFAGQDEFADLVVSVGALRQERDGRTCFSNFGDWVTVYEDGEKLINAFPTGLYTYSEPLSTMDPPQCVYHNNDHKLEEGCTCVTAPAKGSVARFRGMAAWSGTSFATPIIAGRIARHMTENIAFLDEPRTAQQDLRKQLTTISDVGDGFPLSVFPNPVNA